jgi:hypothetical protein
MTPLLPRDLRGWKSIYPQRHQGERCLADRRCVPAQTLADVSAHGESSEHGSTPGPVREDTPPGWATAERLNVEEEALKRCMTFDLYRGPIPPDRIMQIPGDRQNHIRFPSH